MQQALQQDEVSIATSYESGGSTTSASKRRAGPAALNKWNSKSEFILMSLGVHIRYLVLDAAAIEDPEKRHNLLQIFLAYLFIGIPITYMQVAIGQYTHLGILYLKRMIPIADGFGYVSIITEFLVIAFFELYMETLLIYIFISLDPAMEWLTCPVELKNSCYGSQIKCENPPCLKEGMYLSPYVYWNSTYMGGILPTEKAHFSVPDGKRIWASAFSWIMVYLLAMSPFGTVKKVTKAMLVMVVVVKIFLAMKMFFIFPLETVNQAFTCQIEELLNYTSWIIAIRKMINIMDLSSFSYIMFGALTPHNTNTGSLICFHGLIVFGLHVSDEILVESSVLSLLHLSGLKMADAKLILSPKGVPFSICLISYALVITGAGQFWTLLYLTGCCFTIIIRSVLCIHMFQKGLYQRYSNLVAYHVYIAPFFCILGFAVCCMFESKEVCVLSDDIRLLVRTFLMPSITFLLSVLVFYIYGIRRLCDDIHFMQGTAPTKFWQICWILSPIFLIWTIELKYFDYRHRFFGTRMFFIIFTYGSYIIIAGISICKYIIARNVFCLFRPDQLWGPADPEKREARRQFNPRQETRHQKKHYDCKHTCLRDNKILRRINQEEDRLSGLHMSPTIYFNAI